MKKLLYVALIGLNAMSCTDRTAREVYTPQLPPITQTGANTFGAIINGKVMIPRNSIGYIPPGNSHYAVRYYTSSNYEEIQASDAKDGTGNIYIYIEKQSNSPEFITGNFIFQDSNGSSESSFAKGIMMTVYLKNNTSPFNKYLSLANTGSITITRNDSNVISGTFSCKLKNKDNPEDIIEVKDGRFDFNKQTINTTNFPYFP
ncbi:hypothetical protein [Riemerella anatipestifer]|uniref:hypothetical protein n=1 Tax=Riemerella anatipestifer TaxID=34085 RepID=UPI0001EC5D16|nr:hypothetical protein [Riemerella anatipestifer]ADQ81816.1 hypothetical protein Riean_0652 [Riemerella anatipestifer ATCC 11845 = DSM 15868]ADZ12684.1 hypothetical protein RIA_1598 [Riemerella anatipestifer RA-GD]AGC40270.1 hypothetical protein G148_0966 [Riemerella anatipestifer RA-CH-2]AKP69056.1 hypothetical protein CG08_0728 [Riemerella anatipestifer]AKP70932.1 hypothetical protein CG09_0696 [Riemerella anatipestifer]